MDRQEALALLRHHLDSLETDGHYALASRVGHSEAFTVDAESGPSYQIEVAVFWDSKPNGMIRIMGSIDDGGLGAFLPLTESRLLSPAPDA